VDQGKDTQPRVSDRRQEVLNKCEACGKVHTTINCVDLTVTVSDEIKIPKELYRASNRTDLGQAVARWVREESAQRLLKMACHAEDSSEVAGCRKCEVIDEGVAAIRKVGT
jgi:hypothetical protein